MFRGKPSLLIAEYICRRAAIKERTFTSVKIIKLVCIAHGRYLALYEKPLIHDKIDAWKNGPVIPLLYHELRIFMDQPINTFYYSGMSVYGTFMDEIFERSLSVQERNVIDGALDDYIDWTNYELGALMREPGSPWDKIHDGEWGREIYDSLLMEYYKSELIYNYKYNQ